MRIALLLCVLTLTGCGGGTAAGKPARIFLSVPAAGEIDRKDVASKLPLASTVTKWVVSGDKTVITVFVNLPPWSLARKNQKAIAKEIRTIPGVSYSDVILD